MAAFASFEKYTVERPLRLNFAVTGERLARVREAMPFVNLSANKKRKDKKKAETEIAEGRRLEEIEADLMQIEKEIAEMLAGVME